MPDKLFSIVIPIYNAERYLRECLDSVLNQSSKNFDVFMIDDGSQDSSPLIAKQYAEEHPEIFNYVRQDNKGLGGARNTGLACCDGEYSIFLDSDDFIATKMVEHLEKYINSLNEKPDIVLTLPYTYNNVTKTYLDFHDTPRLLSIFQNKQTTSVNEDPSLLSLEVSFWRCIWRTQFLKDEKLKFFEHTAWEDVPPHFLLFKHAKAITSYTNSPTFFYRTNNYGQITAGSGKSRLDVPKVFSSVLVLVKKEKWTIKERVHVYKIMFDFVEWSVHVVDDEYRTELILRLHKLYKSIKWLDFYHFKKSLKPMGRVFYLSVAIKSVFLYKLLFSRNKTKAGYQRFLRLKTILKG